MTPKSQIQTIKKIGDILLKTADSIRKNISFVDIGGGFWPPEGEWLQAASTPIGKLHDIFSKTKLNPLKHYYKPARNLGY